MRRPLAITAAAVLSGTLCGLTGIPVIWTLAASAVPAAAVVGFVRKNRGKRKPLFFIVCMIAGFFVAAFLRASSVKDFYEREETAAFYKKYEASNPGEFDYAQYLKAMGVTNEEERKALKTRNRELEDPVEQILGDLNEYCSAVLDVKLTEHDAGIMKAMLLGNKNEMEESVQDLYRGSGISHLLAVSGLHVSLIGLGLFNLLRKRMKLGVISAAGISGTFVLLYVIFTGASASSIRAGLMFLLSMAAKITGRKTDLSTSLCLAGIFLLFKSPYLITQSGFLLSFSAIAGIILSVKLLKNKKKENACNAFVTCICVTLVTLPVIACSYYKAPLYSVLLNMAVIPLMSAVFLSGAAVLLFGITGMLLSSYIPAVSGFLLWISEAAAAPGHYILLLYEKLAEASMKLPAAEVIIGRPGDLKIFFYYVFLLCIVFICCKMKKSIAAAGLLVLFYGISFPYLRVRETPEPYITALDVGQGDSFHIHSGETNILIDCGSTGYESAGSRIAENYFLSKGISRIDVMIVSHADADHTNGLIYLLSGESPIETETLILPYLAKADEKYDALREAAGKIPVKCAKAGMSLAGDGLKCTCIYSETDTAAVEDTNRESAVWLCEIENFRMLFTGDITAKEEQKICSLYGKDPSNGERSLWNGKASVLKCAHHGSDTATSEEFLNMVQPKTAVLSYGAGNRYGHPSETVVERLAERKIRMYSTSDSGAVTFRIRKGGADVETYLDSE